MTNMVHDRARYVASMIRTEILAPSSYVNRQERGCLEDQDVDWRIILKLALCNRLAQNADG